MLALLADDAVVGHGTCRGKDEIRPNLAWAAIMRPLDLRDQRKVVDGRRAAFAWDSTGVTQRGEPCESRRLEVDRVVDDRAIEPTAHSETEKMRRQPGSYLGQHGSQE